MLVHLHIKSIALIEELHIDFAPGLNVMTGETGAGKSIIVDAMNLVLGERADREFIKSGCEQATVEAAFDISGTDLHGTLAAYGLEDGDTLVFSRDISAAGKNVCRVNGRLTTLAVLKELSDRLVDLHGQHEHQSLLDEKKHLVFLDQYAGETLLPALRETAEAYDAYTATVKKLRGVAGLEGERERRLDMLKFQTDEISRAKLSEAEEEALAGERDKLLNSEKIASALGQGYDSLYAGAEGRPVLDELKSVRSGLEGVKKLDERYGRLLERLDELYYSLEEAAYEFRELKDEVLYDPERIEEIESRLHQIQTLKRKYGGSVASALEFCRQAETQYNELLDSDRLIAALQQQEAEQKEKLQSASGRLSRLRREAAQRFEKDVLRQLADLGFQNAALTVRFEEGGYTRNGTDAVEFYISTNAGEPLKPLKKVVSGGEVSRIMLALKNIAAGLDGIPCMIFDEIDTGISGQMAHVVGEKMLRISRARQVICVTHLAQIACLADLHLLITKQSDGQTTRTLTQPLQADARVREIARLAGGSGSEAALSHAGELIGRAEALKRKTARQTV